MSDVSQTMVSLAPVRPAGGAHMWAAERPAVCDDEQLAEPRICGDNNSRDVPPEQALSVTRVKVGPDAASVLPGLPGSYPDRTPTGRQRRACHVRSTQPNHLHPRGARVIGVTLQAMTSDLSPASPDSEDAAGEFGAVAIRPTGMKTRWSLRRRLKISELLSREIAREILEDGLKPGDQLPAETELANAYNVGRSTLREALRLLEVQGLLQLKPGRGGGPVVSKLSPHDFGEMARLHLQFARTTYSQILDARILIEPIIVRLASESPSAETIAKLREVIADSESVNIESDAEGYHARISRAFHMTVAEVCGNPVLGLMAGALKEIYDSRIWLSLFTIQSRGHTRDIHRDIALAIIDGRGHEAEELMRTHMVEQKDELVQSNPGALNDPVAWG